MESNYSEDVRDRILAAEELFARKGFEGTTVRAVAKRARCNLAAVNYYYHGKEALYLAVFLHRTDAARRWRFRNESSTSWRFVRPGLSNTSARVHRIATLTIKSLMR
jgi:AcrR family transcriptional regulator